MSDDLLRAEGHTTGERCAKCWRDAQISYANGQGAFESLAEAYYEAMRQAEDDAARRAALAGGTAHPEDRLT